MFKIIKVKNPEILEGKYAWYDNVVSTIEFEDGTRATLCTSVPNHLLYAFKNELIEKGYKEEDLEKLLELAQDSFRNEQSR